MSFWAFLRAFGIKGPETFPVASTTPKPQAVPVPPLARLAAPDPVLVSPPARTLPAIPVHAFGDTTSPAVPKRDRFAECMTHLRRYEGGYVDDPRDNGGATNRGITMGTLAGWRRRPVSKADVKALTQAEADDIYRANYWAKVRGDDLPLGVDLMVFDASVNHGVSRANRFLQEALGVTADGVVGTVTLGAARRVSPAALLLAVADLRERLYRGHDDWDAFGKGWMNRLDDVKAKALADCADKA